MKLMIDQKKIENLTAQCEALKAGNNAAYRDGLIDGVRRFAWWKDGVQYVGTSGKTLAEAVAQIQEDTKNGNYRQPY